jgi:periplasmic divalent cation tolerance protein
MMIKTGAGRLDALTERLAAIHPYELPEIVAVPVTAGLTGYLDWVVEESSDPALAGQAPASSQ